MQISMIQGPGVGRLVACGLWEKPEIVSKYVVRRRAGLLWTAFFIIFLGSFFCAFFFEARNIETRKNCEMRRILSRFVGRQEILLRGLRNQRPLAKW